MKNMEKKLKALFSYQEYEKDPELLKMKLDTEDKYDTCLLTDEELSFAFGGKQDEDSLLNTIVSFNTQDGIKTGTVIEIKGNKLLIDNFGWIDVTDIC